METRIESVGRTGRIIMYRTTYKSIEKLVVLFPGGNSEVSVRRIRN